MGQPAPYPEVDHTMTSDRTEMRIIADLASQHLLPPDGFSKWLAEYDPATGWIGDSLTDLEAAFAAGFHLAFWVTFSRVADVGQEIGQVAARGPGGQRHADEHQAEPLKDT